MNTYIENGKRVIEYDNGVVIKTAITENIPPNYEEIKEDAFQEYIRMREIYGSDSPQAVAAKEAYIAAESQSNVKCRSDLENELAEVTKDADKWFAYVMDLEGWW